MSQKIPVELQIKEVELKAMELQNKRLSNENLSLYLGNRVKLFTLEVAQDIQMQINDSNILENKNKISLLNQKIARREDEIRMNNIRF